MKRRDLDLPAFGLWLLTLVSLIALGTLYRLGSAIDDGLRFQADLHIAEITALDRSINLDILKLRHRQKLDYDDLVQASQNIEVTLGQLQGEFRQAGLPNALDPVKALWLERVEAIETFKRLNAIYSTSQFHFTTLSERLTRELDNPKLHTVTRRLHAFLAQGGGEDLPLLLSAVYQLDVEMDKWPKEQRGIGKLVVTHAALILNHHRQIQQTLRELLNSSFDDELLMAYRQFDTAYQQASAKAKVYRQAMAVFALLLVGIVLLSFLRLRYSRHQLERSHQLMDRVADNLGEGIVSFDAQHNLQFINQQALNMLGRRRDQVIGQSASKVLYADLPALSTPPVLQALTTGAEIFEDGWLAAPYGRLPVSFMGSPLPADSYTGAEAGYVLSFRDLSQEQEAQARLDLAAHVFENLSEAMMITDEKGRIRFINRAFTAITGYLEEEAIGKKPSEFLASGQHDRHFFQGMWHALASTGQWQGEIINRRKNGEAYTEWLSISAIRDATGRTHQYIGLFSDISDRKEAEAYIHHLAYHDPLTGLANRMLFRDRLNQAVRQAQRNHRALAVLMFDLDRFKIVNDTLGHPAGDALLIEVARRISAGIREGDTLARLGGDEFALLMPEVGDAVDSIVLAGKILELLQPSMELSGREVFITTSIGIAVYPEHGDNSEQLLRNADIALYTSKNAGRNAWSLFNPEGDAQAIDRLELEAGLRHAVQRRELLLYYQPQIEAETGLLSGVEALVRWQHPERGMIPPDQFIPIAEQTGLIAEIGAWVLETACNQLTQWRNQGIHIPRIAVNVSPRQLRAIGFTEHILLTLKACGIEASQLELELTESVLSENTDQIITYFTELREYGIRIAIDDFGTGYSSLNYLAKFPVDVLKIDRSFVNNLSGDEESSYVVRAIIMLAQGLQMETVAEGVETEIQREQLTALGCTHFQGYMFSRPLPAETIPQLFQQFNATADDALSLR